MINKKTLKSILTFAENQHPAPSFIIIYIVTWFAWHNQLLTHFVAAQGGYFTRLMAAFASIEDNQYIVVLLITFLLFFVRLAVNYLIFQSRELLNNADDNYANARDDQVFAKNEDIANIMATLEKTKQQLADSKEREKKAVNERNEAIKKLLNVQYELDEAKADIDMLNKAKAN